VQEAAAGSGVSYGALYDRYATQVFNYCLRVTGSPDDAADATQEAFVNVLRRLHDDDRPVVEFSSYLFAAARNESYALMRRRARVQPSDTVPEEHGRSADVDTEPERAVLLRDSQAAVREANARLAPRHREVLALRELGDRSYDEIGRIMGVSENGAAQLIFRARTKLREAMTAGAVASVVATSTDCARAQLLLGRLQDGEPVDELDRDWLEHHLDDCGSCRAAEAVLLEVGATYSCWLPVVVFAGLRSDTLTAAGQLVGADWSGVASGAHGGGAGAGAGGTGATGATGGSGGTAAAVAGVAMLAAVGVALSAVLHDDSELPRRLAEPVEQPAVSASAPAKKTSRATAEANSPARAATIAVPELVRALRRPVERVEPGAGKPPAALREHARPPKPRGPKPVPPRTGTPAPALPPLPSPKADPPVDTTPPPDAPQPVKPDPPIGTKPPPGPPRPPPEPTSCNWPGGGSGPGGCPPGHGGIPPGHGGTPPGRAKHAS